MNKKRKPVAVGLTSLFAVLIVLCLVIFAVLSRITAQSELALAQRAADTVSDRYDAEYRYIVYGEVPETRERENDEPPGVPVFDPDGRMPWE
jgi:hypothetical protein